MGLLARVLTAGAAVLVASPAFAHCHFSRTGDCYALAISFEEGWNYSAGVVAPLTSPSTGALRLDTRATVTRAAFRAETPMAKASPGPRSLKDLFADGGRLIDPKGEVASGDGITSLVGRYKDKGRYRIHPASINATDLDKDAKYAVVEWRANIGKGMSHRVIAVLREVDSHWKFDTVTMIRDDARNTWKELKAASAKKGTSSK